MEQIYNNPCQHGGKVLFCQKKKNKKDDGKRYHAEMKRTQGVWKKWCFLLPFLFACFSNLALKIMLMLLVLSSNCKIVGLLC